MGILEFVERAAGALAAEKSVEAADPNAGFVDKAAAAVAGFVRGRRSISKSPPKLSRLIRRARTSLSKGARPKATCRGAFPLIVFPVDEPTGLVG